jgi:hypothetical protein
LKNIFKIVFGLIFFGFLIFDAKIFFNQISGYIYGESIDGDFHGNVIEAIKYANLGVFVSLLVSVAAGYSIFLWKTNNSWKLALKAFTFVPVFLLKILSWSIILILLGVHGNKYSPMGIWPFFIDTLAIGTLVFFATLLIGRFWFRKASKSQTLRTPTKSPS